MRTGNCPGSFFLVFLVPKREFGNEEKREFGNEENGNEENGTSEVVRSRRLGRPLLFLRSRNQEKTQRREDYLFSSFSRARAAKLRARSSRSCWRIVSRAGLASPATGPNFTRARIASQRTALSRSLSAPIKAGRTAGSLG